MSPSAAALDFYSQLRQFDLTQPSLRAALAYARTCRELLLRINAAWLCQQGSLREDPESIPSLKTLFDLHRSSSQTQCVPGGNRFKQLLLETACWFREIYKPERPLTGSYQVWVGRAGESSIRLCGPRAGLSVPQGLMLDSVAGINLVQDLAHRRTEAVGHYDVHGITMLALTLRTLRRYGAQDAKGILGFEKTGDIGKLWKRTIPQAIRACGTDGAVVMIDCPVHSRTPEHTLKALAVLDQVPGCQLIVIDHHNDTLSLAPQLMRPDVQIVLTDVLGCALYDPTATDAEADELRLLGAIADKVPEVAVACGSHHCQHLYAANEAFHQQLLQFSPTPAAAKAANQLPIEPLWESLASGTAVASHLVTELFGALSLGEPLPHPAVIRCGGILFITERLSILGRSWYGLLEVLMEREGCSYAAALRVLDGNRANMLLLTHWKHTHVPPIRGFVPAEYWPRCLGHDAAVWVDLDKSQALGFLEQVAANANQFTGQLCSFAEVADELRRNILNAPALSDGYEVLPKAEPVSD